MKSSYIVIVVLVVALLAGLAWMALSEDGFLSNSKETTVENEEAQPNNNEDGVEFEDEDGENVEHKIVYTGSVFDPEELTVNLGDKVIFINNGDENMQVASDDHPAHTDLEDFESGILEPGDEYSYVFDEAGTWGYHDHLNPSNTGTVEAKEPNN